MCKVEIILNILLETRVEYLIKVIKVHLVCEMVFSNYVTSQKVLYKFKDKGTESKTKKL